MFRENQAQGGMSYAMTCLQAEFLIGEIGDTNSGVLIIVEKEYSCNVDVISQGNRADHPVRLRGAEGGPDHADRHILCCVGWNGYLLPDIDSAALSLRLAH